MIWYVREASVAIYIANLPDIWPLLLEHIRFLRERTSSNVSGPTRKSRNGYAFHVNARNGYPLLRRGIRSHTTQYDIESDEVELNPSRPDPVHKSGSQSTVEAIAENRVDQEEHFDVLVNRNSGKTNWDLEQGKWKEVADWGDLGLAHIQKEMEISRHSRDAKQEPQRDEITKTEAGQR